MFNLRYLLWKLFDENKSPIKERKAWLGNSANKWLATQVNKNWEVLEFGGGGSTLYFSDNCKLVHTIESDKEWIKTIKNNLRKKNVFFINKPKQKYDLILIDNTDDRIKHFELAKTYLKKNGIIIFDNIDRFKLKETPSILFKDYAIARAGITSTGVYLNV